MITTQETMNLDFKTILKLLAKEIYDSPYASLRENLQNAVDAIRVRAKISGDYHPRINILVSENYFEIIDNGIGMTQIELHSLYWAIGKSGKKNLQDICIGTFGIGALANFGVASETSVTSRKSIDNLWICSHLSRKEFENTPQGSLPKIQFSQQFDYLDNDVGTRVRVNLATPLILSDAKNYIQDYAFGLDIPVFLNGSLISGKDWFAVPDGYDFQESIVSKLRLFDEEREVRFAVYEDKNGSLCILFEIDGFLKGISKPEKGPSVVLKQRFKLCDYQPKYSYGLNIRLFVDCWKFSPTAGRDTLDENSANAFDELTKGFEKILLSVAAKKNETLRAINGVFSTIYYKNQNNLLDNLIVRLVNKDDTPLLDLKKRLGPDKSVFYTTKDSNSAQTLAARGHSVILLPGDYLEKQCITNYLQVVYNAKDLKQFDAIEQIFLLDDLSKSDQSALEDLRILVAEILDNPNIKIVPAILKEKLIFYWPQEKMGEENPIYCAIKSSHIVGVLNLPKERGYLKPKILLDLLLTNIGEQIYSYRRKAMNIDEVNIDTLLQSHFKIYHLSLMDVQRIRNTRRSISIALTDIQRIDLSKSPLRIGDDKPSKRIVIIEDSTIWNGHGCYIQLDKFGHNILQKGKFFFENLELWWSGDVIHYYFRFEKLSFFTVTIEVEQLIRFNDSLNGRLDEKRNPLFLEDFTYLPIPTSLEPYVVPTGEKSNITVSLRSKLYRTD